MKFIKKLFKSLKNIITCLILVLVTIFMINNRQIIRIEFNPLPINHFETRLFVLMLLFYALGLTNDQDIYDTIQIDDGIPFRTLTYPAPPSKKPRTSPMFYCEPEKGVRSQEAILRASAYPAVNKTPDNFWANRPPR